MFAVEVRTIAGAPTAIGSARAYTLVVDRPAGGGGGGLGFNGGQLLYLGLEVRLKATTIASRA